MNVENYTYPNLKPTSAASTRDQLSSPEYSTSHRNKDESYHRRPHVLRRAERDERTARRFFKAFCAMVVVLAVLAAVTHGMVEMVVPGGKHTVRIILVADEHDG
jgi:hypothetical protein